MKLHRVRRQSRRPASRLVGLLCIASLGAAFAPASAEASNLVLFDSVARVSASGHSGSEWFYDFHLESMDLPYYEIYLVLDGHKVVIPEAAPSLPGDVQFTSAEMLSQDVDLFFSADMRAVANINNPRLLDVNEMDTYDPSLTDPLAPDTYDLEMRLGFNRELTQGEQQRLGYWAGDLRGMIDENYEFTESDGHPIPEPGSILLGLAGLAGLGVRRLRRR